MLQCSRQSSTRTFISRLCAGAMSRKTEQLEWMYAGGMAAKQEADSRTEAQLLGKPADEQDDESRVPSPASLASLLHPTPV